MGVNLFMNTVLIRLVVTSG